MTPTPQLIEQDREMLRHLEEVTRDNIERIEWTLKDPQWQPTRTYVEKMLASYKELAHDKKRIEDAIEVIRKRLGVTA